MADKFMTKNNQVIMQINYSKVNIEKSNEYRRKKLVTHS